MKRRYRIDDRQCLIALKALREFGYTNLEFPEVRRIANEVSDGTFSESDPVARIIAGQIDDADEMRREAGLSPLPVPEAQTVRAEVTDAKE
jgi:hypothetical protein